MHVAIAVHGQVLRAAVLQQGQAGLRHEHGDGAQAAGQQGRRRQHTDRLPVAHRPPGVRVQQMAVALTLVNQVAFIVAAGGQCA